jgi:hypothetical protein
MAFTVVSRQSVFGNERVVMMEVTADASTQTIETGLKNVHALSMAKKSMNSSNIHIARNSNASGVQSFGVVGISGCTSGDLFDIIVYGI